MKIFHFLFTCFLFLNPVLSSDIESISFGDEEKVVTPVKKTPYEINLREIKKTIVMDDKGGQSSALISYPIVSAESGLNTFAQELDQRFFKRINPKLATASLFCALFGGMVPHPSCGTIIDNIGNFVHAPVSSNQSIALITWIILTTSPIFMQQSFDIGRRILSYIFQQDTFEIALKEGDLSPHFLKKGKAHYVAKAALLGCSLINATIPMMFMRNAEKKFSLFFQITTVPFAIAWFENYYRVGSLNIDYLFEFYQYTSKNNYKKRRILKEKIIEFKELINNQDNNALVEHFYTILKEQEKNNFISEENMVFSFSMLFLRKYSRLDASEDTGLLLNYKVDVDTYPSLISEDMLKWFSTFLMGSGVYSHSVINQYVLNALFLELGASPELSLGFSVGLSAFEGCYRVSTGNYTQQQYFKGLSKIFRKGGNLFAFRKAAGIASGVNAVLFSLPSLVTGLKVFEHLNIVNQVSYLAPSFLLDFAYYDFLFNRYYNEFITNISVLKEENLGVMGKRAHLNFYADKAYQHIRHFDGETIDKLYLILQKGL